MRPPEPLGPQHQLEGFDCGNAALNRWLQQRALANERLGVSPTLVICLDEGSDVIAYACLLAPSSSSVGKPSEPVLRGTVLMFCGPAYGLHDDLSRGVVLNRVVIDGLAVSRYSGRSMQQMILYNSRCNGAGVTGG